VDGGAMILSKKNLTKLSAELVSGCSVHGVKILRADKNNISEISEDFFAALDALEVVDLSANKPLVTLPDAMRNCSKLRELTLATCGLAGVIPPVVFEFSLLSTLDLSGSVEAGSL
jgi:Leucine-rich repeat (LRR) protein